MPKRSDLPQIAGLCGQCRVLEQALRHLDEGAQIVQLTVSYGPVRQRMEGEMPHDFGMTVSTIDMQFPSQVMQAIRQLLQQRLSVVDAQLKQLGME